MKISDAQVNVAELNIDHDFDGFFVHLLDAHSMRLMLKSASNSPSRGQTFHGVGFDKNGEHFDILDGIIRPDGTWDFRKHYNGQGPSKWMHEWRYSGELEGAVWKGGFHYTHAPDSAKPLAQNFFFPNSTKSWVSHNFDKDYLGSHHVITVIPNE